MLQKIFNLAIYLTILCLPLYLIRFKVFWVPFNVLELLIYIVFVLWLVRLAQKPAMTEGSWLGPVFLIFLGATLSTLFSVNLQLSTGIWKAWIIAPILFFIVLVNSVKKRKQVENILAALMLSGTLVAFIALIYWLRQDLTYDGRLAAFYPSANYLAMYLSPILFLSLWLVLKVKKPVLKTALFVICCLLSAVCYLTYSQGAWLGILAGLILFLLLIKNKKRRRTLLIVFAALFFVWSAWLIQGSSFESRLAIWKSAARIIKDHCLIGIGPGMFQVYYLQYQKYFPPYPEWAVPHPHNLLLAFWLQTGLLGLVGFLWLLVVFFKKLLSANRRPLVVALSSAMVSILIHGLVDTTYWKNDLSVVFWLILALGCKADRQAG